MSEGMVSVRKSPQERESLMEDIKPPEFPHGLVIHLDEEVLSKMELEGLPTVGDAVLIFAKATVKSVSQEESLTGGQERQVSLQITDIAVGNDGDTRKSRDVTPDQSDKMGGPEVKLA